MGEEDNLSAANCKMLSYGCTDTGFPALPIISYTYEGGVSLAHRNHDHLGVHQALRGVAGPSKVYLHEPY